MNEEFQFQKTRVNKILFGKYFSFCPFILNDFRGKLILIAGALNLNALQI